jgi:hypothetical protein
VWESQIDNRKLTFRLAGINNQNFIMRDEETGSWWQQITGEAIQGQMKGRRLALVFHDEISFSTWKGERPDGKVLEPDQQTASLYADKDWEEEIRRMPTVTPKRADDPLAPRTLIIGITLNNEARAYPLTELQKHPAVLDTLGNTPLLIVLDKDKKSARAFDRGLDGRVLEFFAKPDSKSGQLVDAETASVWDFSGKCASGALQGKQLKKIYALSDFWFDWKLYNPQTSIYTADWQKAKPSAVK